MKAKRIPDDQFFRELETWSRAKSGQQEKQGSNVIDFLEAKRRKEQKGAPHGR